MSEKTWTITLADEAGDLHKDRYWTELAGHIEISPSGALLGMSGETVLWAYGPGVWVVVRRT